MYVDLFNVLDDNGLFASDLGNLHRSSVRYSGMWISRPTLPSSSTG